jgi:hypothetical protein
MALPSTPFTVNKKQQEGIVKYVQNCVESLANVWNLRQQFLQKDLIYNREVDRTATQSAAKIANLAGDPMKFQNIIIPIVMPQVETALAYHAGVFLTGHPVFGVASNPDNADTALQLETIIGDNSIKYGWVRELILFLRDSLKYNLSFLEVEWKKQRIYSITSDPAQNLGRSGKASEMYYQGNYLCRWDPYNTIWDKRVLNPVELPKKGEFVGKTEVMGRVALKQLLLDLNPAYTMNGREAFQTGTPSITLNGSDSWYYVPQVNPDSFIGTQTLPTTNWLAWADLESQQGRDGIRYNNMYEVTTMYAKIIPQDFLLAVPSRNQPQIWKFIVVNRTVVIYVERMTNAHNLLPVMVGQINEDGLGYQTKSFLDNATPFQYMSSSLWNAGIEAKRRQIFDRIFYDPSRVRKEDIDKVGSIGRIPVKQSAYGKPVGDAVYAFPYRDDGVAGTLDMSDKVNGMADVAVGQNKVQRGQFQKGNKTKQEFDTTMLGANSRQQLSALGLEFQVFSPLKEMIKINMLQYQPDGQLYSVPEKKLVSIKSDDLRKQEIAFQISDGLLPTDKLISGDLLQVFMQTIQTSPLFQAEFDIIGAFAYFMKMNGAHWFNDFRRNPEQRNAVLSQLSQLQAAGKSPGARPQNAENPAPAGGEA